MERFCDEPEARTWVTGVVDQCFNVEPQGELVNPIAKAQGLVQTKVLIKEIQNHREKAARQKHRNSKS